MWSTISTDFESCKIYALISLCLFFIKFAVRGEGVDLRLHTGNFSFPFSVFK